MASERHESIYIGTEGRLLRPLPLQYGAVDNSTEWQRLLAVAEWSAEDKAESLSVYALSIKSDGVNVAPSDCSILRRFALEGTTTALQVAELGREGVMLLAGNSRGGVFRLRLRFRATPVNSASDVEWTLPDGGEGDDESLSPWMTSHRGEVSGLDFSRDSRQAVSVGRDGGIHLLDPLEGGPAQTVRVGRATASYAAIKWASPATFVTAGTTGGLEVWDCRDLRGAPVSRSPLEWGHTGCGQLDSAQGLQRRITCLDVHASRPHLCVSGSSAASVAIWDLRFQAQPVAEETAALGDVTEVHFDTSAGGGAEPSVLFSTDDGALFSQGVRSAAGVESHAKSLLKGFAASIPSFGLDPADGRDIFGLGGLESLLYMHRKGLGT